MSKTNTGGPAFPIPGDQPDEDFNGATLRDYFAGKAMEGMFASDTQDWHIVYGPEGFLDRARSAYSMADAMLKAREV